VEKYDTSEPVLVCNVYASAMGKKEVKYHFNRKLFSLFGLLNLDKDEERDSN